MLPAADQLLPPSERLSAWIRSAFLLPERLKDLRKKAGNIPGQHTAASQRSGGGVSGKAMQADAGPGCVQGSQALGKETADDPGQGVTGSACCHSFISESADHGLRTVRDDGTGTFQDNDAAVCAAVIFSGRDRESGCFTGRTAGESSHFSRMRRKDGPVSGKRKQFRVFCQKVQRIRINCQKSVPVAENLPEQFQAPGGFSETRSDSDGVRPVQPGAQILIPGDKQGFRQAALQDHPVLLVRTDTDQAASGKTGTKVGDILPDFQTDLLGGGEFHLADYRGQVVILNFWAITCAPCIEELPYYEELKEEQPEVEILAIHHRVGAKKAEDFLADKGWDHLDFALDSKEKGIYTLLEASDALPQTIVLDQDGRVIYNAQTPLTLEQLKELVKQGL